MILIPFKAVKADFTATLRGLSYTLRKYMTHSDTLALPKVPWAVCGQGEVPHKCGTRRTGEPFFHRRQNYVWRVFACGRATLGR